MGGREKERYEKRTQNQTLLFFIISYLSTTKVANPEAFFPLSLSGILSKKFKCFFVAAFPSFHSSSQLHFFLCFSCEFLSIFVFKYLERRKTLQKKCVCNDRELWNLLRVSRIHVQYSLIIFSIRQNVVRFLSINNKRFGIILSKHLRMVFSSFF